MTKGIIQEVFSNYFNQHRTYRDLNEPRKKDLIDISELEIIKRELIEKIKKRSKELDTTYYTGMIPLSYLIGDST